MGEDNMDAPEKEVYYVYKSLCESLINEDLKELDRLFMNGSNISDLTGYKLSKKELLEAIQNQDVKYFEMREEAIEILVKEKLATVIAYNIVDANLQGYRNKWRIKSRLSLVKFEEEWEISHLDISTYKKL